MDSRERFLWCLGLALAVAIGAGWMFRHAFVVAGGEVFRINRWTGDVERVEKCRVWETVAPAVE